MNYFFIEHTHFLHIGHLTQSIQNFEIIAKYTNTNTNHKPINVSLFEKSNHVFIKVFIQINRIKTLTNAEKYIILKYC